MDEIFILIDGYPNYAVSNLGRVKSLNYNHTGKEKILSCGVDGSGYLFVVLYKNGKHKHFKVHRLVAQAFIKNPNNLPEVDHINTIKSDNRCENLRWVTHVENCNNEKSKKNHSIAQKGRKFSEETKQKMSLSRKGKTHNFKYKHWKLDPITKKRVWY